MDTRQTMKPSLNNPMWIAIMFLASTSTAFSNVRTIGVVALHEPPVLQPKESLQTEQAEWAYAPNVPPPITRKQQKRVVVNWDIEETQAEIAPGVIYDDYWGFNGK